MNILLRFQDPDWIFRDRTTEDHLLEELDPEEDDLEELELMDEGGLDALPATAGCRNWEDDGIDELSDDTLSPVTSRRRG